MALLFLLGLGCLGALPAQAQDAPQDAPLAPDHPNNTAVIGQRASENALRAASDAFGTSVGRESVGLYSESEVRGFSPIEAGNVRIDGLYFDLIWPVATPLLESSTIHVGISTIGMPFPAPTGIVDYTLRRPGDTGAASLLAAVDGLGSVSLEASANLPIIEGRLGVAGGFTHNHFRDFNGTETRLSELGLVARWTPADDVEILPFLTVERQSSENGVVFVPETSVLPPRLPARQFIGPDWVRGGVHMVNFGALLSAKPPDGWAVRAGVFQSAIYSHGEFYSLLLDVTPAGEGDFLVIADPDISSVSTSGELRVTRTLADGPRQHVLHASLRGRSRHATFDGADFIDLGRTRIDQPVRAARPQINFSEPQRDRVRQLTAGLAYEGRWEGVGEIGIGLSRTDYRKDISGPVLPTVSTTASPWLVNLNMVVDLSSRLAVYAGYVTGLEESGVAPANAVNRNEALPAIETSQRDAGLRFAVTPKLALVAGVFDVRKPYYNLATDGRFRLLGDVVNQGIELSLAGAVTPELSIVTGAVLLRPRVTGEAVARGLVGRLPVGSIERRIEGSADWRPPFLKGVSFDMTVAHRSAQAATIDNLAEIPARTLVDVGGRYSFAIAGRDAMLRVSASNLFDVRGFNLAGAGAYEILPGRLVSAWLTVDF
jgi:iron complex outermembrane receptor protein